MYVVLIKDARWYCSKFMPNIAVNFLHISFTMHWKELPLTIFSLTFSKVIWLPWLYIYINCLHVIDINVQCLHLIDINIPYLHVIAVVIYRMNTGTWICWCWMLKPYHRLQHPWWSALVLMLAQCDWGKSHVAFGPVENEVK